MCPAFLSPAEAAALKRQLEGFECRDPWKPEAGAFRLDQPPPGTHVADVAAAPTLRVLHEIALDRRLLRMAAGYFGCRPYLDSIQAWWSLAGNDEPEEAENYHRDNDSIRFLKFFLYLTDVDEDHGPHKFVIGSHAEGRLLERRRLADVEVERAFGSARVRTMIGRAGDAFMEDTFGIHKGQIPRIGTRLLVQFRYSVTPTVFRSPLLVDRGVNYDPSEVTSLLHRRS